MLSLVDTLVNQALLSLTTCLFVQTSNYVIVVFKLTQFSVCMDRQHTTTSMPLHKQVMLLLLHSA